MQKITVKDMMNRFIISGIKTIIRFAGEMDIYDVEAIVAPQSMPYVLLGNSLLSHFQMTRKGTEMVLERR